MKPYSCSPRLETFARSFKYHPACKRTPPFVVPSKNQAKLDEIYQSVMDATFRLEEKAWPSIMRRAQKSERYQEFIISIALANGLPEIARFLPAIAKANDKAFFKMLGRELDNNERKDLPRLEALLLLHWCETDPAAPSLCYFSNDAIVQLLNEVENRTEKNSYRYEAIAQVIHRLKLRRGEKVIKTVSSKDGMILAK